jgi:hypothetical protein
METKPDLLVSPIHLQVEAPERFARAQVVMRVLVLVLLTAFCQSGLGLWTLAYVALPLLAAVLIERHSSEGYMEHTAPRVLDALEWLLGLIAYMLFVTDRLPLSAADRPLRLHVQTQGAPSVRSALARLATSLPHFIFIALATIVSSVLAVIAAISVVFSEHASGSLRALQLQLVGWIARVLVYHASLVQQFPPVDIDDNTRSEGSHDDPPLHVSV